MQTTKQLFNEWIKSDNVVKVKGGYKEQTSQYRKTFTRKELFTYFKREFIN